MKHIPIVLIGFGVMDVFHSILGGDWTDTVMNGGVNFSLYQLFAQVTR